MENKEEADSLREWKTKEKRIPFGNGKQRKSGFPLGMENKGKADSLREWKTWESGFPSGMENMGKRIPFGNGKQKRDRLIQAV